MRGLSRGAIAVALLIGILPTGVSRAAPVADPMVRGPLDVERIRYNAGYTTVRDPRGITFVERLQGSIHLPKDRDNYPLLIFLHGRHGTCEFAERTESFGFPCPDAPPAIRDVPSYLGYEYLARHLASHGFVVASISANGINSYDLALLATDNGMNMRAEIVARTLDLLSSWNETPSEEVGDALVGRIDLGNIGLMGHSRGGEGVARFVTLNKERTDGPTYEGLRAVFALAPTDFYRQPVAGVHFGTLLPLCDGDVYNLQGAWMYDDARFLDPRRFARVQFAVTGTNHNFFNTVWTFDDGEFGGDDEGSNPYCSPNMPINVRSTPKEQRAIGLALMSAFFLRYVGDDRRYEGYMTGALDLPRRACPSIELACSVVVGTSYLGPSSDYEMVLRPRFSDLPRATGQVRVSICNPTDGGNGCPTRPTRSTADQLTIDWSGKGEIVLPVRDDVGRFDVLTFRAGQNFETASNRGIVEQDFEIALVDEDGTESVVSAAAFGHSLRRPEGPSNLQLTLSGTRIPLREFSGIDLARLDRIELRFGSRYRTGSIQLLEVAFQRG